MLSQTVAAQTTKITSIERIVGSLLARVTTLETVAASGSSGPTRQDLGSYSDIAMTPQPLGLSGPMAQGLLTTIEIQDEDLIHS